MTKRYDTYKDSGVQWLGEIPGHWNCTSLGRMLSEKLQYGASESGDLECTNDSMRYIRITDITLDGKLKSDGCKFLPSEIGKNYPVRKGDVLLARSGATVGKAFIYNEEKEACYAGYLIKASVQQDKVSPQFFFYYTQSSQYNEWKNRIFIQATIQNISAEKYARMSLCIPPLSEQHSIVSYLDDKCAKIDKMLEGKQKQIELLAEMKQRIIADAVTRGLNPDVKMKATNIPWLKEIPEHWESIRLSNCISSSVVGSWGVDEKKDGTDILCLRVADFDYNKGIIKEDKLTYRNYEGKLSDEKLFKEGDLLLEKSGGGDIYPVGRVVRYSLNGRIATCSNFIQKLTPNSEFVSSDFLYFWFKMIYSLKVNGMYFNQTTGIQNLKVNEYLKQMIYLPPLSEQRAIVSYITEKTTKIDTLAAKLQQEIESIKEYKQRLISDVVTGQIKVC